MGGIGFTRELDRHRRVVESEYFHLLPAAGNNSKIEEKMPRDTNIDFVFSTPTTRILGNFSG
jgi:hypothetical protein